MPENTFLAFDYGTKRTGVASGNVLTRSATPQPTLVAEGDARFPLVPPRLKDWPPEPPGVGWPPPAARSPP